MAHLEFNDRLAVHGTSNPAPGARRMIHNRPVRKRTARVTAPTFDPALVSRTLSPKF